MPRIGLELVIAMPKRASDPSSSAASLLVCEQAVMVSFGFGDRLFGYSAASPYVSLTEGANG